MASLRLGALNQSVGNTLPGAITGESPNPSCAAVFASGTPSYLTTGSLSVGDTGELGGLAELTIEFWLTVTNLPAGTRNLIRGPEVSAGNRQWSFQINSTGTITFNVFKTGPTLVAVTSSTALIPTGVNGTPYYIVGVVDPAGFLRLYINAGTPDSTAWTLAVAATSLAAGDAGAMLVNDTATTDITNVQFDELAIYRRFIGASRISAHYTAGTARGFTAKLPGARMIDVLDQSQSVHSPRSLMAGSRAVTESYMMAQSPLDELNKARSAENVDSMVFISKSGMVTFLDASHRSTSPWNTVQIVFGDAGGTELSYTDFGFEYSHTFIANRWEVTREQGRSITGDTGATQVAEDSTSELNYFKRSQALTNVPVTQDSDASAIATAMLAKYKDPMYRGFTLTVNTSDPNVALNCLQRELGDRIEVKRTPPGGGARIDQVLFIQKIEVSGDASSPLWTIRFGLSPL